MLVLDLARLVVGGALLGFAAWTDHRWRRAPNALWLVMVAAGVTILAIQAALDPAAFAGRWPYLVGAPLFAGAIYVFWRVGLLAGGADAKALMALAVLLPFPLVFNASVPVLQSPLPGSVVVLGDSLLAVLFLPLVFIVRNLLNGDLRFPAMFLGYKLPLAEVPERWVWPMEHPDGDGGTNLHLFASKGPEFTWESLEELEELGIEEIWVTPKVPFMLPLTGGFLLAFLAGDVLTAAVAWVLPMG